MRITERTINIPALELVVDKLNKLTYIKQSPAELETEENFTVSFTIIEDIGPNKDITQLTIRVFYKQQPVYTTATIERAEQKEILDWFYKISEKLHLQEEKEKKEIEEEGVELLNNL
tara:strand:+ start:847 stop:1197 length:351 start_codon:yes stop_codon:yes gene_type:complete